VKTALVVSVIDYGAGNVASVERSLQKLDVSTQRVTHSSEIRKAQCIVLPGVGHFAAIMRALDENDLREALLNAFGRGIPFLGICLGLQALYSSSEEAPALKGLNLFPQTVRSLPAVVKLPHMGWNRLQMRGASSLLAGLSEADYFYFAHSFAVPLSMNPPSVAATCKHGADFIAVLEQKNVFATQFHPEKSGAPGARVLRNFVELAA
jgi:imidazole glycerol phosphate synthase glutamine amidotransferase subunit